MGAFLGQYRVGSTNICTYMYVYIHMYIGVYVYIYGEALQPRVSKRYDSHLRRQVLEFLHRGRAGEHCSRWLLLEKRHLRHFGRKHCL